MRDEPNRPAPRRDDPPEVNERFSQGLPFVHTIARQVAKELGPSVDADDYVSFGMEGLLVAARRFDPTLGCSFRSYSYHRIRGAILDGIRADGQMSRRTLEKVRALDAANLVASGFYDDQQASSGLSRRTDSDCDDSLHEHMCVLATAMAIGFSGMEVVVNGERIVVSEDSPDANVERDELIAIVRESFSVLTDQEREFVTRHFFKDENIEDIAVSKGLSKSWGSRVVSRAIAKLSRRVCALL